MRNRPDPLPTARHLQAPLCFFFFLIRIVLLIELPFCCLLKAELTRPIERRTRNPKAPEHKSPTSGMIVENRDQANR